MISHGITSSTKPSIKDDIWLLWSGPIIIHFFSCLWSQKYKCWDGVEKFSLNFISETKQAKSIGECQHLVNAVILKELFFHLQWILENDKLLKLYLLLKEGLIIQI